MENRAFGRLPAEGARAMTGPMPAPRAGRTVAAVASHTRQHAIPQSAVPRTATPTTRRRAALGHPGPASAALSWLAGDVCVRYESVHRRAEHACGART